MFGFLKNRDRSSGKDQRRRFYRIPVSAKGEVFGPGDPECRHAMPCTLYDLSGSGAALKSYQLYDEKYVFRLRFRIPGDPVPVTVLCETVRSSLIKKNSGNYPQYLYGVRFLDTQEQDVDRIAAYVARLQRSRVSD